MPYPPNYRRAQNFPVLPAHVQAHIEQGKAIMKPYAPQKTPIGIGNFPGQPVRTQNPSSRQILTGYVRKGVIRQEQLDSWRRMGFSDDQIANEGIPRLLQNRRRDVFD